MFSCLVDLIFMSGNISLLVSYACAPYLAAGRKGALLPSPSNCFITIHSLYYIVICSKTSILTFRAYSTEFDSIANETLHASCESCAEVDNIATVSNIYSP